MADLWRLEGYQFLDDSGNPLNGGKLYYYDATTTNERTVYQDALAATPWTQPITLESNGRLLHSIYIPTGAFKEKLTTSAGVELYTEDLIPGAIAVASTTYAAPDIPVISKATNYVVLTTDQGKMIKTDTTGGNVQLTLPSCTTAGDGFVIFVQHTVAANITTIVRAGSDTINGATSLRLTRQWGGMMISGNGGTAWTAISAEFPHATPATKTTTYAVTVADIGKTILVDATAGAFDVDLPAAATAGDGFEITVVKIDAVAAVTIDPDAAELINGAAGYALTGQWRVARVRCNGTAWHVLSTTGEQASETVAGVGEWATAAEWRANTADRVLVTDRMWSSAAHVTLTDAATIAVDMSTFLNATVTLTDNRTLGAPTNPKIGQSGVIRIVQDGTGSRTLAYHADWKFAFGTDPVLSTAATTSDLLFYQHIAANFTYATLVKAVA